jgi:hypothetical protein
MLYLAIDQHGKQLTVNLRDEEGTVLVQRQVSTRWAEVEAFLAQLLAEKSGGGGGDHRRQCLVSVSEEAF